jgi:hypothetical protein
MSDTILTRVPGYYPEVDTMNEDDADLEPYKALFLKPLTSNKCAFSKYELEVMCKDPMHSPRLIMYLIDFVKNM